MEALLPKMRQQVSIACCGGKLSDNMPRTKLWEWLCSPRRKEWRIWHARRNNDMLLGLFLRHVLRQKLILLFTSAAQREHSWLTKFCYRRMDAVIATTGKAAGFLKVPATVSHHGVDAAIYEPAVDRGLVRQQLGLLDRPTLGVFGRVRPQKGTGDLVEALVEVLPQFPQWQVVFVGAVTEAYLAYQADLEARLKKAGVLDRVFFKGFLKDFSTLPRWYQAVDVVGCVSRNEGFGVTCLEGMASGVPVVATRAGAWEEIVTDGEDGWIVNASDPTGLAKTLERAFGCDHEQRAMMGQRARQSVVDRFTIECEIERISDVYSHLFARYQKSSHG